MFGTHGICPVFDRRSGLGATPQQQKSEIFRLGFSWFKVLQGRVMCEQTDCTEGLVYDIVCDWCVGGVASAETWDLGGETRFAGFRGVSADLAQKLAPASQLL